MLTATHPNDPCKVCGKAFIRFSSFESAVICGKPRCVAGFTKGLEKARKDEKRAERAEFFRRKEEAKPRPKLMGEAQSAFNSFIRARDSALPCISCQRYHIGSYDAGHYLSVGARPELRFDEENVHRQCVPCNQHLHGNIALYRMQLVKRIGQEAVDRLEGPHLAKKYTAAELSAIKHDYRTRARALIKARENQ